MWSMRNRELLVWRRLSRSPKSSWLSWTDEQDKYENTDAAGNTLEPLAKDLIAELESRKDELLRQSNSQ